MPPAVVPAGVPLPGCGCPFGDTPLTPLSVTFRPTCGLIPSRQSRAPQQEDLVRKKAEGRLRKVGHEDGSTEARRIAAESARNESERFRQLAEEARQVRDQHHEARAVGLQIADSCSRSR